MDKIRQTAYHRAMRIRHTAVPASYLFLIRNRHILLQRRQNTGFFDGWLAPPAGHMEPGELPTDCLIRESIEEIGIRISPEDIRLAHAMYRTASDETGDRADYFFAVERWSGEPDNLEPDKCSEQDWYPLDDLPDCIIPHVRMAIDAFLRGEMFSELGTDQIAVNPSI